MGNLVLVLHELSSPSILSINSIGSGWPEDDGVVKDQRKHDPAVA
jgi:hypothetical protein